MKALSRRGVLGSVAALSPAGSLAVCLPGTVHEATLHPDARFLAHLATFEALQRKVEVLDERNPDMRSDACLPEMYALWDQQTAETEAMVALGCTTWAARHELAAVLTRMGHRELPDDPDHADEDRLESLLLRSMFGGVGGAA